MKKEDTVSMPSNAPKTNQKRINKTQYFIIQTDAEGNYTDEIIHVYKSSGTFRAGVLAHIKYRAITEIVYRRSRHSSWCQLTIYVEGIYKYVEVSKNRERMDELYRVIGALTAEAHKAVKGQG